jgi:predicted RNA-binding protein with PUA-like domain
MGRWLFKTEPSEYSFEQLLKDKKTVWDGVTNALALIHLRAAKKGDEILVYHTGEIRSIVGVARAVSDARGNVIEVAPVKPLLKPVTLAAIKANRKFERFELVRNGRLSIMPVPEELWAEILKMASA